MTEKNVAEKEAYFGAANTYRGFKSYFGEIFNPLDYSRIYVIKGGPGTGKSSMMKKISAYFADKECSIEEIYCSSDPRSLDGVIVSQNGKKIAVIDGTAPHETDAKIPGAIDEIINLGDNWDCRWLSSKRDIICDLNKEKKEAYSTAYSYLKIAGEAADFITNSTAESFDFSKAKNKIVDFCHEFNSKNTFLSKTRLISAFGKNGYFRLDTLQNKFRKTVEISGAEFPALLLLNVVSKLLLALNTSASGFPTALNPNYLDAIQVNDTIIIIGGKGDINADELMRSDKCYSERIKSAAFMRASALDEAKRWFGIASDLHFRLEEIYSSAMNFEKNEELLCGKLSEMENILEV